MASSRYADECSGADDDVERCRILEEVLAKQPTLRSIATRADVYMSLQVVAVVWC